MRRTKEQIRHDSQYTLKLFEVLLMGNKDERLAMISAITYAHANCSERLGDLSEIVRSGKIGRKAAQR